MSKRRKVTPAARQARVPVQPPPPVDEVAPGWRLWLRRSEIALAVAVTVIVVGLHLLLAKSAGPLWRDEIDSVNMANLPTWSDFLAHMPSAFPVVWYAALRLHAGLGLGTTAGFRALGCCVGLLAVFIVWRNARRMNYQLPLVTLVLVGMSPAVIRWGDSIRAYGLGLLLLLWVWGSVWRFIITPTRSAFVVTAVGAILAANCVYYNSIFLLAILGAGILVCLKNGERRRALGLLAAGALAAASMLPYAAALMRGGDPALMEEDLGLKELYSKFSTALNMSGAHFNWIWFVLVALSVALGFRVQLLPKKFTTEKRNLALFSALTIVFAFVCFFIFLLRLRYATNSWYYIILMGVTAAAMEAALAGLVQKFYLRIGQALVLVILVALTVPVSVRALSQRQTNVDLVAAKLEEGATGNDFIIVSPWYMGMSFNRYYHGHTPWSTLPPLPDHEFHRFDLVREKLSAPDQFSAIQPVLDDMTKTLSSGHRVWIVGWLKSPAPAQSKTSSPTSSDSPSGNSHQRSEDDWLMHTERFIEEHAPSCSPIKISSPNKVYGVENLPLYLVQGWKPPLAK